MNILTGLLAFLGGIVLIVLIALILAIPTMLLWNWLVPVIFLTPVIAPKITLLQALGINFLCAILFKGSSSSSSKD